MSRPNFCPNCGAALAGETAAAGILDERSGDGGYDCYCGACGWSGDVFPDDEDGKETEEGFRHADLMDLIGEIETAKILGDEEAVAAIRAAMAGEARGVPDSSDQRGGEGS